MVTKKTKKSKYVYAVGRRKEAAAQIRLFRGKVESIVNDLPISKYFSGKVTEVAYTKPFVVTDTVGKFYITAKVVGSGMAGQLGAVVHGTARALDKENCELYHSLLKKAGLLTRDPRVRERRKAGQMGKARKKKQSPKR